MVNTPRVQASMEPLAAHDKVEGNSDEGHAIFREVCDQLTTAQIGEIAGHRVLAGTRRVTRGILVKAMDLAKIPDDERILLWQRYFGGPAEDLPNYVRQRLIMAGGRDEYSTMTNIEKPTIDRILKQRTLTHKTLSVLLQHETFPWPEAETKKKWREDFATRLIEDFGMNVLAGRMETLFEMRPDATRTQWVELGNMPESLRGMSKNNVRILLSNLRHGRSVPWELADRVLYGMSCTVEERVWVAEAWLELQSLPVASKGHRDRLPKDSTGEETGESRDPRPSELADVSPTKQRSSAYPSAFSSRADLEIIAHLLSQYTGESVQTLMADKMMLRTRLEQSLRMWREAEAIPELQGMIVQGEADEYVDVPEGTDPLQHMREMLSGSIIRAQAVIAAAEEFTAELLRRGLTYDDDLFVDFLYVKMECDQVVGESATGIQHKIAELRNLLETEGGRTRSSIQHIAKQQGLVTKTLLKMRTEVKNASDAFKAMRLLLEQKIISAHHVLAMKTRFEQAVDLLDDDVKERILEKFRYIESYCTQVIAGRGENPVRGKIANILRLLAPIAVEDEGDRTDEFASMDEDEVAEDDEEVVEDDEDEVAEDDEEVVEDDEDEVAEDDEEVVEDEVIEDEIIDEDTIEPTDEEIEEADEEGLDKEPEVKTIDTKMKTPDGPPNFAKCHDVWRIAEYLQNFLGEESAGYGPSDSLHLAAAREIVSPQRFPFGLNDIASAIKIVAYCYPPGTAGRDLILRATVDSMARCDLSTNGPLTKTLACLMEEPRIRHYVITLRDAGDEDIVSMLEGFLDLGSLTEDDDVDIDGDEPNRDFQSEFMPAPPTPKPPKAEPKTSGAPVRDDEVETADDDDVAEPDEEEIKSGGVTDDVPSDDDEVFRDDEKGDETDDDVEHEMPLPEAAKTLEQAESVAELLRIKNVSITALERAAGMKAGVLLRMKRDEEHCPPRFLRILIECAGKLEPLSAGVTDEPAPPPPPPEPERIEPLIFQGPIPNKPGAPTEDPEELILDNNAMNAMLLYHHVTAEEVVSSLKMNEEQEGKFRAIINNTRQCKRRVLQDLYRHIEQLGKAKQDQGDELTPDQRIRRARDRIQ